MEGERVVEIPETFRGLDPDQEVTIYYNNGFPHWRQQGATYFVTFRLADALPQSVLRDLEIERCNFKAMIEREKLEGKELRRAIENFSREYGQRFDDHLDRGAGSCLLSAQAISSIVADALTHFAGERYELYAVVVMPNHCHILVRPFANNSLEDILESWKGFSARQINRHLNRRGTLWQADSFDRIVRDDTHFINVVQYIHANPIRANLATGSFRLWDCVDS